MGMIMGSVRFWRGSKMGRDVSIFFFLFGEFAVGEFFFWIL